MSAVMGPEPEAPGTDEKVMAYARDRGVTEILHFTTDCGLLGSAATGALLSRDELRKERQLDYIRVLNCPDRSRDARWTGHVSLSITKINRQLLLSSKGWHPEEDLSWCVLAFDASILGHPEVWFADSNNAYPITKRDTGVDGLSALFADAVTWGYYSTVALRTRLTPLNLPTHDQAEVLYPGRVSLQWLRHIYVPNEDAVDWVISLFGSFTGLSPVPVECKPEVFR